MTLYARVVDNLAVELFDTPDDSPIEEWFHPIVAAMFIEVPEGTVVNSTWNPATKKWVPPKQPSIEA